MGDDLEQRVRDAELASVELRGRVERLSDDVRGFRTYLDTLIKMQTDVASIQKNIQEKTADFENKIKGANMIGCTILSLLLGVLVKMLFFGDIK